VISNQKYNQARKVEDFSLPDNYTVQRILVFIKDSLPKFESIFKQSDNLIYKEDDISKELFRYFGDLARSENLLFQFNEKKGADFTVYVQPYQMGAESLFMIEAKRLTKKHYDYVSGSRGGIERIKREQDDFGKHLKQGGMIGYIQEENQDYWFDKINKQIDVLINQETDIIWDEHDKITPNLPNSSFISSHSRVSKDKITLHHFWIDLN